MVQLLRRIRIQGKRRRLLAAAAAALAAPA